MSLSATTINENGSTTLSGTFTDPGTLDTHTVTINWGDGSPNTVLNLAAGVLAIPATSHQYLDDGVSPGNATASDNYTIGVTVADDDTGIATGSTSVTVNNVAPSNVSLSLSAPTINENGSTMLSGTFTDPGTLDTHTVTINWGDGSAAQAVNLAAGVTSFSGITHTYLDDGPSPGNGTASDVYSISVTLSDDDGGVAGGASVSSTTPAVAVFGSIDGGFWTFGNLNNVMSTVPGASAWSMGSITSGQLTTTGLGPYNVLVINTNDRSFVTAQVRADVTSWVNAGGKLILAPAYGLVGIDPFLSDFGATHQLQWNNDGWCGETQSFSNPSSPLVNIPNVLDTSYDFNSGFAACDHETVNIGSIGSAWDVVGVIPAAGNKVTLATANAGEGAIVASTIHWSHFTEGQKKLAENAIRFQGSGSLPISTSVTVNNLAPSGLSLNSGTINENGVFTLMGSFTDPGTLDVHTVTVNWGEGAPQTVTLPVGARSFTLTHQYLDDNPTVTNQDNYTINVTLADDDSGSTIGSTVVTVKNVAPTLSNVAVSSPINENDVATLSGTITDPGTQDTFTLTVNWGDGSLPQTFSYATGTTSFSETHQYLDDNPTVTPSDMYTVAVTVTDDDGGNSEAASDNRLYGLSSNTDSLYAISSVTGAASFVAAVPGNVSLTGLDFLNGNLYASDVLVAGGWRIGTVDLITGAFTSVGNQDGSANWWGLAANETAGLLYSIDINDGNKLKSMTAGGVVTTIGAGGGIYGGGMAYDDANGILYATGPGGLYTVNTTTGLTTVVGPMGISTSFVGLAYDEASQLLFANNGANLYRVNPNTGATTLVGSNLVSGIDGLAWGGPAAGPATTAFTPANDIMEPMRSGRCWKQHDKPTNALV